MKKDLQNRELRAVRAEAVCVKDAAPFGWLAYSEPANKSETVANERVYHLYCEPQTRRLVCTCADFIFRGEHQANYECKHIVAALKHIARNYLTNEYRMPLSRERQAA